MCVICIHTVISWDDKPITNNSCVTLTIKEKPTGNSFKQKTSELLIRQSMMTFCHGLLNLRGYFTTPIP